MCVCVWLKEHGAFVSRGGRLPRFAVAYAGEMATSHQNWMKDGAVAPMRGEGMRCMGPMRTAQCHAAEARAVFRALHAGTTGGGGGGPQWRRVSVAHYLLGALGLTTHRAEALRYRPYG